MNGLPDGRRGQILAVLLLGALIGLAWMAVIAPLRDWYDARSEQVATRRGILLHMVRLVDALPGLRQTAGAAGTAGPSAAGPPAAALLAGDSDAIAGAALQGMVQDMAGAAGVTLTSAEALPAEQRGAYRRIGLRIALSGDWSVLVAMLQAVESSQYRLLVDDVQLHATARIQIGPATAAPPIDASFVVLGFRPALDAGGHDAHPNAAAVSDLRAEASAQAR